MLDCGYAHMAQDASREMLRRTAAEGDSSGVAAAIEYYLEASQRPWAGVPRDAEGSARRLLRLRQSGSPPDTVAIVTATRWLGVVLREQDDLVHARETLEGTLTLRARSDSAPLREFARCDYELALTQQAGGDSLAAAASVTRAVAEWERTPGPDSLWLSEYERVLRAAALRDTAVMGAMGSAVRECSRIREFDGGWLSGPLLLRQALRSLESVRMAAIDRVQLRVLLYARAKQAADSLRGTPRESEALQCLARLQWELDLAGTSDSLALQRALRTREQELGPNAPDLVWPLMNLGRRRMADSIAAPCLLRAIAIESARALPDTTILLDAMISASIALSAESAVSSDRDRARVLGDSLSGRAFEMLARYSLPPDPVLLALISLLGSTTAEPSQNLRRALQGLKQHPLPQGDTYVFARLSEAVMEFKAGNLKTAIGVMDSSLAANEVLHGPETPALLEGLQFLGAMQFIRGDLIEARGKLERGLKIVGADPGLTHDELATAMLPMGWVLMSLGNFAAAESLVTRALRLVDTTGVADPNLIPYLGSLGETVRDPMMKIACFGRALAILAGHGNGDSETEADLLERYATWLDGRGEYPQARDTFALALTKRRESGPSWTDAADIVGLAHASSRLGAAREACDSVVVALGTLERALGSDSPALVPYLAAATEIFLAAGDSAVAAGYAARVADLERAALEATTPALSEREALMFDALPRSGVDWLLSLTGPRAAPPDRGRAWNAVIASRALVLDEIARRHRRVADVARQQRELTAAAKQLATLTVSAEPMDPVRRRVLLGQARDRKERAERALGAASADAGAALAGRRTDAAQVQRAVPRRSALVSFRRYHHLRLRDAERAREVHAGRDTVESYVAFVARAGRTDPDLVPLGPAATVDSLVAAWSREIASGRSGQDARAAEARYRPVAMALRARVWDPVAARLDASDTLVFLVPDGALHLVSFPTLPAADGRYLVESGPALQVLTTERDLVALQEPANTGAGMLALGGVDYDHAGGLPHRQPARGGASRTAARAAAYRGPRSNCETFRSLHFLPLPGTRFECDAIVADFRAVARTAASGERVELLTGGAADEASFKTDAPGHRILHLATHGFLLSGRCGASPGAAAGPTSARGAVAPVAEEDRTDPLLLSGLALAGANNRDRMRAPDAEDGVLTAEEVGALDLSGVEWAVLSGCETGAGEIRAGEGVFGLQRAFRIAGARTLVMSLWSVGDRSTEAWMQVLYHARLRDHASTATAVRTAARTVLEQQRRRGAGTHPFYWGAFVAAGDWR